MVATKDDVDNDWLSTEAIIDNIFTLIFAGSDTTASVLTSTIKLLSEQPDLLTSLRRGLANDKPDDDVTATLETLVKDVMTRNPPAPFAMRLVGNEPLNVNGYVVPSNWLVAYGYAGTLFGEGTAYNAGTKSENHDSWRSKSCILC